VRAVVVERMAGFVVTIAALAALIRG